jgi:hypothetical protein
MGFWIAPRELRQRAALWFLAGLATGLFIGAVFFSFAILQ